LIVSAEFGACRHNAFFHCRPAGFCPYPPSAWEIGGTHRAEVFEAFAKRRRVPSWARCVISLDWYDKLAESAQHYGCLEKFRRKWSMAARVHQSLRGARQIVLRAGRHDCGVSANGSQFG
jgi:hypothetical protein